MGDAAKGFYFASSALEGVVNENVGKFPVAVFADKESAGNPRLPTGTSAGPGQNTGRTRSAHVRTR
ncbi:MAG: hypothetical protein QF476_01560 [Dehalococcoidia bacterium]|nr:hypothetical protein [Chloroflexota bacterium]MDP7484730.1 hypothetical protein [Dehalococcoidia bacterium]